MYFYATKIDPDKISLQNNILRSRTGNYYALNFLFHKENEVSGDIKNTYLEIKGSDPEYCYVDQHLKLSDRNPILVAQFGGDTAT